MPSKKKKYNSRFPPGRIKKIMQTDEEVGKVAQAVPVIISRALELFVESLLTKAVEITSARNAKTLTPSHMKQCILSESRFDFLKEFVKTVPDLVGDTDDLPGPSGSGIEPMASESESGESIKPSFTISPGDSSPNGFVLSPAQDVPLNLVTSNSSSAIHKLPADIAAKTYCPSTATSSADSNLDEDYDT